MTSAVQPRAPGFMFHGSDRDAGAIRMARDMGPGKTIVTVLCDAGQRYASKVYDPAFLTARGLPTPEWLNR